MAKDEKIPETIPEKIGRQFAEGVKALKTANADPTGQKVAIAAGQAARQEAIDRGKGIEVRQTPTGAVERKEFSDLE